MAAQQYWWLQGYRKQAPLFHSIQAAPDAPWTSVSTVEIPVVQPGGYFLPSFIPVLQVWPHQPYYPNPLYPVDRQGKISWPRIYPLQDLWDNSAVSQMMQMFFPGGALQ